MPSLEFKGKNHIYAHHLTVPHRPLEVDASRSMLADGEDAATTADQNLIIHGDNLQALKALLPQYAGKVKCIYIDPPYNTGNEGWVYNDRVNSPLMKEWLARNSPVDGEDLERHDKWLCMMWPRLHLLRELLRDDGVIFVSIDDNEVHHLRMLMDEIFGEENFVSEITVVSNLAGSSDQFGVAGAHEYCLVYLKSKLVGSLGQFSLDDDKLATWELDESGYYKPERLQRGSLTYSQSLDYPIFVDSELRIAITEDDKEPNVGGPFTRVSPLVRGCQGRSIWRWSKQRILNNPGDVFAKLQADGNVAIFSKQRPKLGDLPTEKPKSVFYRTEYSSRAGGKTLSQLFSKQKEFNYPKALGLIRDFVHLGSAPPPRRTELVTQ